MHLSGLDFLFWVAGFVGHVVLLFVLWWRKRASHYPIFTTLIVSDVVRTVGLYFIHVFGTKGQYYYAYWFLSIVDVVFELGVIYELAAHTFRPLGVWAYDLRGKFVGLISLYLGIASALTWLASPRTRTWMGTLVIKGTFFSSACVSELFVGMLAISATAGLPMKTHAAKILQGLGVYSIVELVIDAGHGYLGSGSNNRAYFVLSHIRMAVYLGCLCYWILTLWPDQPAPRELTNEMRLQLSELQRGLQESLRRLRSGRLR